MYIDMQGLGLMVGNKGVYYIILYSLDAYTPPARKGNLGGKKNRYDEDGP